jgi:hypothetical protein
MADSNCIHLVREDHPTTPNLEPPDIVQQALAIARECTETLDSLQAYESQMIAQLSAQIAQLEIVALRAIARKGGGHESPHTR